MRHRGAALNDVKHTLVIGERINPTGRKKLAGELMEGRLDIVLADARRQADAPAQHGAGCIPHNGGTGIMVQDYGQSESTDHR